MCSLISSIRKRLLLEVTIDEMGVHVLDGTLSPEIHGAVIKEALNAGIKDINFWGFAGKHAYTWRPGARPLMIDKNYGPKPALYATYHVLERFSGA